MEREYIKELTPLESVTAIGQLLKRKILDANEVPYLKVKEQTEAFKVPKVPQGQIERRLCELKSGTFYFISVTE